MRSSGSPPRDRSRPRGSEEIFTLSAGQRKWKATPTNALSCSALAIDRRLTFKSRDAAHKLPRSRLTPPCGPTTAIPRSSHLDRQRPCATKGSLGIYGLGRFFSLMRRRAPTRCLLQILGLRTETQTRSTKRSGNTSENIYFPTQKAFICQQSRHSPGNSSKFLNTFILICYTIDMTKTLELAGRKPPACPRRRRSGSRTSYWSGSTPSPR